MSQSFTDHLGRPVVAVTGMGIITSLGKGKQANWEALTGGKSGIHAIDRFPTGGFGTVIAGTVDFMPESGNGAALLSYALAEASAAEALEEAGISGDLDGPLFLAAPPMELEWQHRFALDKEGGGAESGYANLLANCRASEHADYFDYCQFGSIADHLQEKFGARGLPVTLSTACASGATAIQLGVEAIRRGEADRVLSIGTDGSVTAEALVRFSLLSALSTQNAAPEKAARPFSKDRDGFVMAEGSAALVMESLESATKRGAKILGILKGCGEKADDFHRTRSKPDASPAIGAVQAALSDAGIEAGAIDYINAHGTSTPENDKMEYLALASVFGERIHTIPVSSNKSMVGHTLTAAGAVEAVFSLLTIANGLIPPTINNDNPDPAIPLDVVPNQSRKARIKTVLSNSFGFGGQNTCLVMSAAPL